MYLLNKEKQQKLVSKNPSLSKQNQREISISWFICPGLLLVWLIVMKQSMAKNKFFLLTKALLVSRWDSETNYGPGLLDLLLGNLINLMAKKVSFINTMSIRANFHVILVTKN